MRVGVYVGSFDPIHLGHLKIAKCLVEHYLDKVIFVPTGNYGDKNDLVSMEHRINMIRACADENMSVYEDGDKLPYTYQVLETMSKLYPNDELHLIIGADNIVAFDEWKEYKEVLKYHLVIIRRNGIDIEYYLRKLRKDVRECIIPSEIDDIAISSTKIRRCIKNGDIASLNDMVDENVLKYILGNKLYTTQEQ